MKVYPRQVANYLKLDIIICFIIFFYKQILSNRKQIQAQLVYKPFAFSLVTGNFVMYVYCEESKAAEMISFCVFLKFFQIPQKVLTTSF